MSKFVYVLRVVDKDMKSSWGFKYPRRGRCTAPDWDPYPECGNGLHGWLNGEGFPDISQFDNIDDPDLNWLVIKVNRNDLVELSGKCKFRTGYVVFCGTRDDAIKYLEKKNAVTDKTNWRTITLDSYSSIYTEARCLKIIGSFNVNGKVGDCADIKMDTSCNFITGSWSKIDVYNHCIIKCGSNCTVSTGYDAIIKSSSTCKIRCGTHSIVKTLNRCTIIASAGSNIETGSDCLIKASFNSKIKSGTDCRINCDGYSQIESGSYSTVKTGENSIVNIGHYSSVNAGTGTTIVYNSQNLTFRVPRHLAGKWLSYSYDEKTMVEITDPESINHRDQEIDFNLS